MLTRALLVISLCAATGVSAASMGRARERPYDVPFVPSPGVLRWVSLGHATSAANVYWMRAVQYIGEPNANERGWDRLFPVLDLVTDLDPRHGYAYQVGGIILGSVGRVAESNAILEKGIQKVPDRYILPFLRAFNAFYYENDFALAGRYVEHASRIPSAPAHLRQTALAFYVKGREADAAIEFLERARAEARDVETTRAIDEQLKQAHLERAAQFLDDAVARYRARYGVFPPTLPLLVATGFAKEIPPDPFGGSFVIGDDGRVHSTVNPFRFKRPSELGRGLEPGVTPESGYPGVHLR